MGPVSLLFLAIQYTNWDPDRILWAVTLLFIHPDLYPCRCWGCPIGYNTDPSGNLPLVQKLALFSNLLPGH